MPQDSVTITDHRTGNTIESPVSYGTYPNNGASTPSLALRSGVHEYRVLQKQHHVH